MDHINYSYTFDALDSTPFRIKFNPISRELKSHKEEILETANHIANTVNGPIYLFSSGGIDSEIIGNMFLGLGRDFKVITLQLKDYDNNNDHDTMYAKKWCNRNKVTQIFKEVNIGDFVEYQIPKYIDQGFKSQYIYRYLQIFMIDLAESLGGIAVLGGRESNFYKNENGESCLSNGVWFNTGLDYCSRFNKQHYPAFYLQNSEILASYFNLPLVNTMIETPGYFGRAVTGGNLEKILEYQRIFPEVEPRRKFTGYEQMAPLHLRTLEKLSKMFPEETKEQLIPVSQIKSQFGI
jgi:hypothetical protein